MRLSWTDERYLLYCPCSGRLGNQLDHMLSVFSLAEISGRTLVLMPFISYTSNSSAYDISISPFENIFDEVHVEDLANATSWSRFRDAGYLNNPIKFACFAKRCALSSDLPYSRYWELLGVHFNGSFTLTRDVLTSRDAWRVIDSEQIIVLPYPPGTSPPKPEFLGYQRMFRWSSVLADRNRELLAGALDRPYLAVHLRVGQDVLKPCRRLSRDNLVMSFSQCSPLGIQPTFGNCIPSREVVISSIARVLRAHTEISTIYMATDSPTVVDDISRELRLQRGLHVVSDFLASEFDDLMRLEKADVFLGSCVSSYSAFVRRQRLSRGATSHFISDDHSRREL